MLPTGMKMGCAARAGGGEDLHVGQFSERRARTGRVFAPLGFLGPSERHAEAGHAHTEPLRKLLLLLDHLE